MSGIVRANNTGQSGVVSDVDDDVITFMETPSSANLISALTDETGTGAAVFGTSPTLGTPALGTPASGVLTNATGLPTTGIVDNAVTLAKMNGITRGSIIVGDSSGDPAALAIGGNTYVLTSDATDIAWAAASSGPGQAAVSDIKAGTNQDTYIPPDLVSQAPNLCKGWVMRSGNGTVEVSGGNIASITDTGVGNGTINFTASMTATGYGIAFLMADDGGYVNSGGFSTRDADGVQILFRHHTGFTAGALYDAAQSLAFFGNLA